MSTESETLEDFLAHYGIEIDENTVFSPEMTDLIDAHLAHYGVKGMKWGVIREQQEVIRRAQAMKDGTTYKKGVGESLKTLKAYSDRNRIESGDMLRDYVKGKAYLEGKEHTFKLDPTLKGKKSVDELMNDVVKPINPEFGKPGTVMNCRRATLTYEMRRRGYDVKATYTTNASGQHIIGMQNALTPGQDKATRGMPFIKEVTKMFKDDPTINVWGEEGIKFKDFDFKAYKKQLKTDAKKNGTKTSVFKRNAQAFDAQSEQRAQSIMDAIGKQGDGARGEVGMGWLMGGGHSVAYEVVGGKPVVFDNQSGKKYQSAKELTKLTEYAGDVAITRLDNKELNMDYLTRWAQDA